MTAKTISMSMIVTNLSIATPRHAPPAAPGQPASTAPDVPAVQVTAAFPDEAGQAAAGPPGTGQQIRVEGEGVLEFFRLGQRIKLAITEESA
jgi:hypothetical protein